MTLVSNSNETLGVLTKLAGADFDFYLTGSRYFGDARNNSDWDFFVQDEVGIGSFLETVGFIRADSEGYEKPLQEVLALYQYPMDAMARENWSDYPPSMKKRYSLIDVQISANAEKKNKIQTLLRNLGRSPVSHEWALAFKLAEVFSKTD